MRHRSRGRKILGRKLFPSPKSLRRALRWAGSWWRVWLVLLATAALALSALYSPYLRISRVTVEGARQLDPVRVAQVANLWGQSTLAVYGPGVAASLAQLPQVKSASLSRRGLHEIALRVEERQPWAVWQARNAQYIIDEEGIIIATASAANDLPTIKESADRGLKPGDRVNPQVVRLAQSLAQSLPAKLGATPRAYDYAPSSGLTVLTDKGWRARFGGADDLDFKLATLRSVLETTSALKIKPGLIDLRFGDRPYFR